MSKESDKVIEKAINEMQQNEMQQNKTSVNFQNRDLIDVLSELKFGRKAFDQHFLDKCICELKMLNS